MQLNILLAKLTVSGVIASSCLTAGVLFAEPADKYFDSLLSPGTICGPSKNGQPPLLKALVLATAETAPFRPKQRNTNALRPGAPPLYTNLGTLHFKVATKSARAQAYFDQGIRLMFAFNHSEARRAFINAQKIDPACAMCFWGEALVLGPNINAPMFPEAVAPAVEAARKAATLITAANPMERALINALTQRYSEDPKAERAALDKAYADAMGDAAREFRREDTVQVLFAEALMDLSPWDYWEAAGAKPKGRTGETIDALERVLERNPTHPGAIHYYIHTMEASSKPDKALPYARTLGRLMPGAGHIVHMPAHIYYRVGLYKESLAANRAAIEADERYFAKEPSDPLYKGAYYPHNIHFVMVSALMGGDGKSALEAAAKLDRVLDPVFVETLPPMQTVKAASYFSHVQFSEPDTILSLPDPGKQFILVNAMWHYARSVAFSRKANFSAALKEIGILESIERDGDLAALTKWDIPGKEIVQTARLVALGRLADARGDKAAAVKAYEEAVFVQDALPYTEPPHWYYPVRQSLGAALLRAGHIDDAEKAFRESLAQTPSNGWALRGLIEVYRTRGDMPALRAAQNKFDTTWLGAKSGPALPLL